MRRTFPKGKEPLRELETQDPPIPSLPEGPALSPSLRQPHPGFFSLPKEIRDVILTEAFGNVRVHIDLRLLPPRLDITSDVIIPTVHGGPYPPLATAVYDWKSHQRAWKWHSSVCHSRSPVWNLGYDTLPHHDTCLSGRNPCVKGYTTASRQCRLGVIGFMMSCKQA